MDDKKYYDFMHHIPHVDGKIAYPGYECGGYVAMSKIPFKKAKDAVSFAMGVWPELSVNDKPVVFDKEKTRQIAKISVYELIYLRWRIHKAIEAKRKEYSEIRKQVNELREAIENPAIQTGIMEGVYLEVLETQLERMGGYLDGMDECWKIIHNRQFELLEISKEPYSPEWRF